MQGAKANGSLLCVPHPPIFLITAGLRDSDFDFELIPQCDLSGLAELRHNFQEIAVLVPLARPFYLYGT